jgi:hypothetical protein
MKRKPSPALIVSIIALIVACSGSAVAASGVIIKNSRQIAKGAITSSDLRNHKGVGFADLTPSAVRSIQGLKGAQGPKGDPGKQGPPGAGTASAFALIGDNANVVASLSQNITQANVYAGGTPGQYCIKGLSFTPKSVIASIDAEDVGPSNNATISTSTGDQGSTACPQGSQAGIYTVSTTGGTPKLAKVAFYVIIN